MDETFALLQSIAIMGALAIVALIALYVALGALRRGWADNRPPLLGQMLARRNADPSRFGSEAVAFQHASATYRCLGCGAADECRRWLDSGARDGYQKFCPNAGFVESLRRGGPGAR